jgi:hypothetical protein
MDHFVGAVLDGSPFAVDLDQVLAGVRLIEECYRVAQAA